MDSRHSPWNSDQVLVASDEDSDLLLQLQASLSGSECNQGSSEQDFGPESSLHFSGRIISVTFTIPYRLQALKGKDDWVRMLRLSLPLLSCQLGIIIARLRFRELTQVGSRSLPPP